jgi:TonB family protein
MPRRPVPPSPFLWLWLFIFLFTVPYVIAQKADVAYLNKYVGNMFVLRAFPSADRLQYDSTGLLTSKSEFGDWTSDGFVTIKSIHTTDKSLVIEAQRLVVGYVGNTFQLFSLEEKDNEKKTKPVIVTIESELEPDTDSPERVKNLLERIFLNENDNLLTSLPDYWSGCIIGATPSCALSPQIKAVPGLGSDQSNMSSGVRSGNNPSPPYFHAGAGVLPPNPLYRPSPEFTQRARQARLQGTVKLEMVIDAQGRPTRIKILQPLGGGLDEVAVHTVAGWKFEPATKDGEPVPVVIAIEVDFHMY